MFDRIEKGMYWDRTWKLVEGCTPVSEGCAHCWSARETHMRAQHPNTAISNRNAELTQNGFIRLDEKSSSPIFNGNIRVREDNIYLPGRAKKPAAWAVWNDFFHESVPEMFIHRVWDQMSLYGRGHIYFVLTKRPERMKAFVDGYEQRLIEYADKFNDCPTPEMRNSPAAKDARKRANTPPKNSWLGVTAENQEQADKRIPILLQIPAAKRYVSIEPMLGSINISPYLKCTRDTDGDGNCPWHPNGCPKRIDWVICGGESGPGARPMHPDWVRSLRNQCQDAGVPFFFKQWGEWYPDRKAVTSNKQEMIFGDTVVHRVGKAAAGRMLDGREWLEVPRT